MNAGLYKYFLDQKFCINLSVYAILNKRRNLTTITNNNLSRIEENNKTPYQGACLNLIYKFDFGKKVKVKRAKSIQTTSDSYSPPKMRLLRRLRRRCSGVSGLFFASLGDRISSVTSEMTAIAR